MARIFVVLAAFMLAALPVQANEKLKGKDLENVLILDLNVGRVVIEMHDDIAPKHVERIKLLTREGFYDGIVFHRVMRDFMAQTGDPTGTGTGGSKYPDLKAEFNKEKHYRGAVSMARANSPNSANSQFFIVLEDSNFLDRKYTVWGHVIDGMKYVDRIKLGDDRQDGHVQEDPDYIVKAQIAADVVKTPEETQQEAQPK